MNARRPMKMVQKISFLCCQFCSYKTRFTGNLAKHIRTHTGERPFECQFCGKRFASKSNYNTHVVIHSSFGTPLKFPFGEKSVSLHTRVKCEPSNRTLTSSVNSEVVRSVPMVKTLLSSSRSSSRSAVQKLSPIGSFLTPNQGNASFSHSALYSPLSFSPFGSSQPCRKDCFVEDATETSFTDHPVNFLNNEGSNIDSSVASPEAIETTNLEIEENRSLIEDVKPTIFDILSALPETDRASFAKKVRDSHLFASIKEEAADRVPYVQNSNHVRSGRTRRLNSNCSDRKSIDDLDIKDLNGHCSGYGVPCALGRLEDDPRELRAQMLVDSLIKDSRLFRCDSCNILFPEYGMYVLHLGCHGSEGAYQCHFCRRFFDDKFGFATHFVRCPHEPSDSH